ncbi:hypothetical protein AAFF_G00093280 [Aldrovandia affinis]|uniref:Uncharacterized protein n=1 Tax=Aldrovandia affinis TaxID=143900 RepID=A0AAD7T3X5_9TELE|nr:hypothetical protein AAFF_G00093280 [Aldrovandia affinis]
MQHPMSFSTCGNVKLSHAPRTSRSPRDGWDARDIEGRRQRINPAPADECQAELGPHTSPRERRPERETGRKTTIIVTTIFDIHRISENAYRFTVLVFHTFVK